MALRKTAGPAVVLVVIGSIQTVVVILDAACDTPGTRRRLIIVILGNNRRILHVCTVHVRVADVERSQAWVTPARRLSVHP
ncbi:hypothetical protein FHT92_003725 [Rhizobium sp. BK377]|nr:hypothetical protein [Rhizobium sp. BK377]